MIGTFIRVDCVYVKIAKPDLFCENFLNVAV